MSDRMSIDKWRVRKLVYPDGFTGNFPWYVIPQGVPTPKDAYEAYDCFHADRITTWRTHQMALTEALDASQKTHP